MHVWYSKQNRDEATSSKKQKSQAVKHKMYVNLPTIEPLVQCHDRTQAPGLTVITLCCKLCQLDANLCAMTNNLIPNYAKALCCWIEQGMHPDAHEMVELALGQLVAIQDEVGVTHNAIYAEVGIAK